MKPKFTFIRFYGKGGIYVETREKFNHHQKLSKSQENLGQSRSENHK